MEIRSEASNIATRQELKVDNPKENKVELKVLSAVGVNNTDTLTNSGSYVLNISDEAKALNIESGEATQEPTSFDPGGGHPTRPKKKTE
jgi:hypothetical protein